MTHTPAPVDSAIGAPTATLSTRPVTLPAPERGDDLQVRVTAPRGGEGLPVVLFSHGFGFSMDAYGPLTDFWAAPASSSSSPPTWTQRRWGWLPPTRADRRSGATGSGIW